MPHQTLQVEVHKQYWHQIFSKLRWENHKDEVGLEFHVKKNYSNKIDLVQLQYFR